MRYKARLTLKTSIYLFVSLTPICLSITFEEDWIWYLAFDEVQEIAWKNTI